jgi:hypothetical protein
MAQSTRGSRQADVLVIGSNLTGLLLAESLRQQGRDVVVLETGERLAGLNRPLASPKGHLPPDLGFLPETAQVKAQLDWLKNLLRIEMTATPVETPPVTYDEGQLKTFVGFGEHNPPTRDEVTFYTANSHMELTPTLTDVAVHLTTEPKIDILPRKQVTKILCADGRIEGVEVNGEEIWRAPELVWTAGPSLLLEVLPVDAIEGKHRTRFAKAHTWATVSLHLHHQHLVTMERGVHVLYGSGHEGDPVVGRFWPALPEGGQHSVWFTLVPSENADDPDHLGHALRHLKRQIKRSHPHVLDDILEEKLLVAEENHGHMNMRVKDPYVLPELKGFWFASPLLSDLRGPLAAVDVAHQVSKHWQPDAILPLAAAPPEVAP